MFLGSPFIDPFINLVRLGRAAGDPQSLKVVAAVPRCFIALRRTSDRRESVS